MKKFALVSHVLPPSWSGQSVVLGRILRDIDPSLFILLSTVDYQKAETNSSNKLDAKFFHIKILRLPSLFYRFGFLNWFIIYLDLYYRALQIAKTVNREKCKSIVSCSGDLLDIPSAYLASILTGIQVIPYYFDDYVFQWPDPSFRNFAQKFEKKIFSRRSTVIVPNEFMKEELRIRQNVVASIVRNPVDSDLGIDNPKTSISTKEIRILYTGAIYHVNITAFHTLLKAINTIKDLHIGLHLYTAQSGEYLINEGIKGDFVHINSHASAKETALAQQQANILFVPFSFDSTVPEVICTSAPGKLADYLSSGVPILAFVPPNSFVAWFLKQHQCGMVIDQNNPHALAKGIVEIARNEELRKTFVQNAQNLAKEEFDANKASKNFINIITKQMD